MKHLAVGLLLLACWIAPRFRPRSPPKSNETAVIIIMAVFGVMAGLTGLMQAASLVGKRGQEISESAAMAGGLLFVIMGAWMVFAARRGFTPELAGDDGAVWDRLLLWAPAGALALLVWWFEVP